MALVKRMLEMMRPRRALLFIIADIPILALCMWLSFLIRFEWTIPSAYLHSSYFFILIAIAVKVPMFYVQGLYNINWSYVSIRELLSVFKGVFYSSFLLGAALFILRPALPSVVFPRSVLVIDFFLTLVLIGGLRAGKRVWLQFVTRYPVAGRRTLVVGAGDAGEQLVRSMRASEQSKYLPIGFVDDAPGKQGTRIQGVKVLGKRKDIPRIVQDHDIQELLLAMCSASSQVIKETVELGRKAGVKSIRILPDISELLSGQVGLVDVREVELKDLLRRQLVAIDTGEIQSYLKGKKVMVTGAAGTIGSELCRQIGRFFPQQLIMLDHEETGLFRIDREIQRTFPQMEKLSILGDIRDEVKVRRVFSQYGPKIVFHAAAYKHVGMTGQWPDEAVKDNIFGTKVLGEAAIESGVERFVLISSDKAVNPVGVMGMTKRVAELIIQNLNERRQTKFSAVRFGNVLGSRGSVIPIFKEQIRLRGPVTVTDPDMLRYFMMSSEAVLLVLQAGAIGRGGEVFVLDMGKPVRIMDLAQEMIRLSGYEPDKDIPISIVGADQEEKMFEDILTAEEGTKATKHAQIFVAKMPPLVSNGLSNWLEKLESLVGQGANDEEIKAALRQIIQ